MDARYRSSGAHAAAAEVEVFRRGQSRACIGPDGRSIGAPAWTKPVRVGLAEPREERVMNQRPFGPVIVAYDGSKAAPGGPGGVRSPGGHPARRGADDDLRPPAPAHAHAAGVGLGHAEPSWTITSLERDWIHQILRGWTQRGCPGVSGLEIDAKIMSAVRPRHHPCIRDCQPRGDRHPVHGRHHRPSGRFGRRPNRRSRSHAGHCGTGDRQRSPTLVAVAGAHRRGSGRLGRVSASPRVRRRRGSRA